MAKKPTLSPTKLTTYLACPVKYGLTYVEARGSWYLRSKSYYSFGITLHKVLEQFHDPEVQGVKTVAEAVGAVEENWIDAGYASAEEMAEAQGDGKMIIEQYLGDLATLPVEGRTLFVEKSMTLDFENFKLVGRIDRVVELDDGTLEIVDYKSGRTDVSAEEVALDIAMGCYQLMLRQMYPGSKVRASLVALRTGSKAFYSFSDAEADEFNRDIEQIGLEMLRTDYSILQPKEKPLCPRCDFLRLCSKAEGFHVSGLDQRSSQGLQDQPDRAPSS